MSEPIKPEDFLITYPCEYLFKIIIRDSKIARQSVLRILQEDIVDFETGDLTENSSHSKNFVSLRLCFIAQSEQHIFQLHEHLKATGYVIMVV